jgi:hypothetical protein
MKATELKLCLIQGVNNLIDDYFGSSSKGDKFINSTLKIMVRQNTYKVDEVLELFTDEHGCIDENVLIEEYSKVIGDKGIIFDIRDFVKNELIKSFLPDKALVIKKDDLRKMFSNPNT